MSWHWLCLPGKKTRMLHPLSHDGSGHPTWHKWQNYPPAVEWNANHDLLIKNSNCSGKSCSWHLTLLTSKHRIVPYRSSKKDKWRSIVKRADSTGYIYYNFRTGPNPKSCLKLCLQYPTNSNLPDRKIEESSSRKILQWASKGSSSSTHSVPESERTTYRIRNLSGHYSKAPHRSRTKESSYFFYKNRLSTLPQILILTWFVQTTQSIQPIIS